MSEDNQEADAAGGRFSERHPREGRAPTKLNAQSISFEFSPELINALHDLESAVRSSEHFDRDIYKTLHDWVAGEPVTLEHVLIALPTIIQEGCRHAYATRDERAEDAVDAICNQMCGNGFTLTLPRSRGK